MARLHYRGLFVRNRFGFTKEFPYVKVEIPGRCTGFPKSKNNNLKREAVQVTQYIQ